MKFYLGESILSAVDDLDVSKRSSEAVMKYYYLYGFGIRARNLVVGDANKIA